MNLDVALELKSTLPERVAQILIDDIQKGLLHPLKPLPTEAQLADKFGVSRTVIREALVRLKHDGYIEPRQGVGTIVTPTYKRVTVRFNNMARQSIDNTHKLYELRIIIDSNAAALAAIHRLPEDISSLYTHLTEMKESILKGEVATGPDLSFHEAMAAASHNGYLFELNLFLNDKVRSVIRKAREKSDRQPELAKTVQGEHEKIFEAIKSRDPQKAKEASLDHLINGAKRQGLSIDIF